MSDFKIKINAQVNFSSNEAAKLVRAVELWQKVWQSEEFQNKVRNFGRNERSGVFGRTKWVHGFRMTSLSNRGVIDKIVSGSERLEPEADKEADIYLTLDRRDTESVIGYTYPATKTQWIYSKFFNKMDEAEIAGNLAHEYCHKLGFGHESKPTALRPYTVPYGIGYLTRDIARKIALEAMTEKAA